MKAESPRWLPAVIVLAAVLVLVLGTYLLAQFFFTGAGRGPFSGLGEPFARYSSNGERIFRTGTSASGPAIRADEDGMQRMGRSRMACADCHGADGRGGTGRLMMSSFEAPDIRYSTLTEEDHGDAHAEHPPYTDEDIKRAITEGIDPAGEPLEWPMPRWTMSAEQLDDLIEYLKTLE
jgi:cytochrome c oxidase subunit II